jgi:hypothetical protein
MLAVFLRCKGEQTGGQNAQEANQKRIISLFMRKLGALSGSRQVQSPRIFEFFTRSNKR